MAGLSVRFWGVRGSLATPGRSTSRYGGNTACVEVSHGDTTIVFDMGSGLRELGNSLIARKTGNVTFFLSHYHWDHILGLPFFGPAYFPKSELTIYGATRAGRSVREILAGQMINPYFPVSLGEMSASLKFRGIESGSRIPVGELLVEARELSHPGGAQGFRVDGAGASVVYATDFEHGTDADEILIDMARDCDLLIYDAMYTPEEYRTKVGWGHSTWEQGVRIAKAAGVKKLVLFHHEPGHDDAQVDAILRAARAKLPGTQAAREGQSFELGGVARPARLVSRRTPARAAARRIRGG